MTTVYYNPACSKCRAVKKILDERAEPYELVEYLKSPPDGATLESVAAALDTRPSALLRRDERSAALLAKAEATAAEVVALLVQHPDLLERPVVVRRGRAIVARPPERVLELLPD